MREKKENFELELYEVIGIKTFRKMVFVLRDTLIRIIYFWMSKERINELLNDGAVGNNYSVNKTKGIKGFKDFKKAIIFNAFVHIIALVLLFFGTFSLKTFVLGLINLYCIILQRYNWIRVNRIIKRGEKREERQKEAILNDLKKIDSEVEKHSYKQEKKAKKRFQSHIVIFVKR